MFTQSSQNASDRRTLQWLTAALFGIWLTATFGVAFWARELSFLWGDWPFSFWMVAQGSVLVFLAITVVYAAVANRLDKASNVQDLDPTDDKDLQP